MMNNEIIDNLYLQIADIISKRSPCHKDKVGAIIVKNDCIISSGYNSIFSTLYEKCEDELYNTKWQVIHAESNAIVNLNNFNNLLGSTMYITTSPCKDCSKLIFQSGIIRVVYAKNYRDLSGIIYLKHRGLNIKHINIYD